MRDFYAVYNALIHMECMAHEVIASKHKQVMKYFTWLISFSFMNLPYLACLFKTFLINKFDALASMSVCYVPHMECLGP